MRNLKKLLAVLVSVAIMITAFVPAFAAEATKTDAQICEALGALKGGNDGVTDAYLALGTKRIQAAIILLRLKNLESEARSYTASTVNFKDANQVSGDTVNLMAYLKNTASLGWQGGPSGNFSPMADATPQMIYKVMLEALGYKQDVDFTYAETLTFAAQKGLSKIANVKTVTNNDMAIAIVEALKATVKGSDKTLATKLVEDKVISADVAEANGLYKKPEPPVTALTATAKAVGVKKIQVSFNKAVEDTSKATFTVEKGAFAVNITKTTFAADKKSAVIELTARLNKGDYTVTVIGLTDDDLVNKIAVEDEKVAKIEFVSDKAALVDGTNLAITAAYKVYNQYGEDITATAAAALTFTASKGSVDKSTAGVAKMTVLAPLSYTLGENVSLSIVDAASGTFVTKVLSVSNIAQVATITIDTLYNKSTIGGGSNATPSVGDTAGNYVLVVTAKDQYGNEVAYNKVGEGVIVTNSNPAAATLVTAGGVPTFSREYINGAYKTVLTLNAIVGAGTTQIGVISKTTGARAVYDVVVKDSSRVDTLSLTAPDIAVAGESIKIPFTAVDQYGKEITDVNILNAAGMLAPLTVSGDPTASISFVRDYVNNVTDLVLNATLITDTKTLMITGLTKTGKYVQMSIVLQKPAEPQVASVNPWFTTYVAVGGSTEVGAWNFVAKDQYGRNMDNAKSWGKYFFALKASDGTKIDISDPNAPWSGVATPDGYDSVVSGDWPPAYIKGLSKGTATVTVTLWTRVGEGAPKEVAGSDYSFTVNVVEKDDIASYELKDFGKLYQDNGGHKVQLTVIGKMADGSEVCIPQTSEYFTVDIPDASVSTDRFEEYGYFGWYLGNKVTYKVYSDDQFVWASGVTERTVPVIVNVNGGNNNTYTLSKNVTISNVAPYVDKIQLDTGDWITKEGDAVMSATAAAIHAHTAAELAQRTVKFTDQYGADFDNDTQELGMMTVRVTNLAAGKTLSNVVAGDTFYVTVISNNGKTFGFKVVVK